MRHPALLWIVILVGAAACAAITFDNAGVVMGATDADMLWPVSFVWDAVHRVDGWRGHNLPRVPSLFPDLAIWAPLYLATGSARWTAFLYGTLQFAAIVTVGGWIAAQLAGRAWIVGSAAVLAVLTAVVGVGLTNHGGGGLLRIAVLPLDHVGPFVAALLIVGVAARRLTAGRPVWPLALLGAMVVLSDELLVIEFILPLLAAAVALGLAGRIRPSQALGVIGWIAAGLAAGTVAFRILLRAGLSVDPAPPVSLDAAMAGISRFVTALKGLIAEAPIGIVVFAAAVIAFAILGRRLAAGRAGPTFLWATIGGAAIASIAFTACFYQDLGGVRYLAGLWCCVVLLLGAWLCTARDTPRLAGPLASVAALAAVLCVGVFAIGDHGGVRMLRWRDDVADCVRRLRGPLDLHAGLAGYWVARPTEVGLRFTTQIDQINDDGAAYTWASDARWFRHSFADPARPPDYDFVVLRRLDPARIAAHYGRPDRVEPCGDTAIWIYRDRDRLYHAVTDGLPPASATSSETTSS